ncbi:protein-export chaperone SecB [Citrobacter freundii]|uniref:protein-export chaperone SecB n=1 Tax=Citrobacter freundii TaxID=546 RepID=UPI00254DA044|nr:protein-export chaperone SecB [Citrobacter freundii]MDK6378381.1 protein-export chaperone SecB [Citrobacter freundii]
MKLRLKDNTVNQLLLVDAEGRKIESGFALRFKPIFGDNARQFTVLFDFYYITENDRALRVEFHSVFETDRDIDDDFRESKFPIVNAPAISFPFLRSFVANFLISSGYNPILLPTFNFTTFEQDVGEFPD